MAENQETKKVIPPYLPYRTFTNLLDRLKANVLPARIDRSIVGSFSGAIQSQIFLTLKYLSLTDEGGVPSEQLAKLVNSADAARQQILHEIVTSSYPFVLKTEFNLRQLTGDQLIGIFNKEGCSGETTRKAVAFFMAIAKDAGMELSPYLKRPKGKVSRGTAGKKKEGDTSQEDSLTNQQVLPNLGMVDASWQQQVLSKIPNFNPAWKEDERKAWFEMMSRLIDDFKRTSNLK
jgi:hypothetical protein